MSVKCETLMIWLLLNMLESGLHLAHVNSLNAVVSACFWRTIVSICFSRWAIKPTAALYPEPEAGQWETPRLADLTLNGWEQGSIHYDNNKCKNSRRKTEKENTFREKILYLCTLHDVNPSLWLEGNNWCSPWKAWHSSSNKYISFPILYAACVK